MVLMGDLGDSDRWIAARPPTVTREDAVVEQARPNLEAPLALPPPPLAPTAIVRHAQLAPAAPSAPGAGLLPAEATTQLDETIQSLVLAEQWSDDLAAEGQQLYKKRQKIVDEIRTGDEQFALRNFAEQAVAGLAALVFAAVALGVSEVAVLGTVLAALVTVRAWSSAKGLQLRKQLLTQGPLAEIEMAIHKNEEEKAAVNKAHRTLVRKGLRAALDVRLLPEGAEKEGGE